MSNVQQRQEAGSLKQLLFQSLRIMGSISCKSLDGFIPPTLPDSSVEVHTVQVGAGNGAKGRLS